MNGRLLIVRRMGMMIHRWGVVMTSYGVGSGTDAFFKVVEIARSFGGASVMLLLLLLRRLCGMMMHVDNDRIRTGIAAVDVIVGIVFGIGWRRFGP